MFSFRLSAETRRAARQIARRWSPLSPAGRHRRVAVTVLGLLLMANLLPSPCECTPVSNPNDGAFGSHAPRAPCAERGGPEVDANPGACGVRERRCFAFHRQLRVDEIMNASRYQRRWPGYVLGILYVMTAVSAAIAGERAGAGGDRRRRFLVSGVWILMLVRFHHELSYRWAFIAVARADVCPHRLPRPRLAGGRRFSYWPCCWQRAGLHPGSCVDVVRPRPPQARQRHLSAANARGTAYASPR